MAEGELFASAVFEMEGAGQPLYDPALELFGQAEEGRMLHLFGSGLEEEACGMWAAVDAFEGQQLQGHEELSSPLPPSPSSCSLSSSSSPLSSPLSSSSSSSRTFGTSPSPSSSSPDHSSPVADLLEPAELHLMYGGSSSHHPDVGFPFSLEAEADLGESEGETHAGLLLHNLLPPAGTIAPGQLHDLALPGPLSEALAITPLPHTMGMGMEEEKEECEEGKGQGKKAPPRKRKRTKANNKMMQTAVTLPREDLLKLSSKELDEYAERIRQVRPLTSEEEKDIRRQRRLIKNRESAHLSRQRRKSHMETLEGQLNAVNEENSRLKAEMESLRRENSGLKEQVGRLAKVIQQTPSLLNTVKSFTSVGKTTNAQKTMYLLMILFSFGLFFNARMLAPAGPASMVGLKANNNPFLTAATGRLLPDVTPPNNAFLEASLEGTAMRGARKILQHGQDSEVQMPFSSRFEPSPMQFDEPDILSKTRRNDDDDDNILQDDNRGVASVQLHRVNKSDERALDATEEASASLQWGGEAKERLLATVETTPSSQPLSTYTSNPNKTLFLCPALTPISVSPLQDKHLADSVSMDADGDLTFLLPASAAKFLPSASLPKDWPAGQSSKGMVRLSCRLLDARPVALDEITSQRERPLLAM